MTTRSMKVAVLMALLLVTPLSTSAAQRARGGNRPDRAELELNVRIRLATLLRTELGLNDEGMRQLSEVNQRFDRQRREVNRREMMTRRSLRDEVLKLDSADTVKVNQLMTEQFKIERERIDLTEAEQGELSKFLTPLQRARYLGVQEQVRRQMEQMRGRAGDAPTNLRGRRPPPG